MEEKVFSIPKLTEFFDDLDNYIENYQKNKRKNIKKENLVWAREELWKCLEGLDQGDLKIIYYIHHLKSVYKIQALSFLKELYKAENRWIAESNGEEFRDYIYICR